MYIDFFKQQDVTSMCQCPDCGTSIPRYANYSPWCESCDWNLQPSTPSLEKTQRAELLQWLAEFSDSYVFNDVTKMRDSFEGITFPQIASLLIALFVYFVDFSLLILSYSVITGAYSTLIKVCAVILATIVIWTLVPRFDVQPDDNVLTGPDDFPAINQAVARISKQLGVKMPDVLMTEQFTATFGRIGIHRRPLLALGHPFLSILTKEEFVSLLAHEISHSFDGSLTRSVFVRHGLQILRRWQKIVAPSWYISPEQNPSLHRLLLIPTYLLLLISLPLLKLIKLMHLFAMRDSQRAEYVADARSFRVAGNLNTLSLLRKSHYRHLGALRTIYHRAPSQQKFAALQREMAEIPQREIERIWRIAKREPAKINRTHPRLKLRIAFLESMERVEPSLILSQSEFADIQRELAAWPCFIRQRENDWKDAQDALQCQQENGNLPLAAN